MLKRMLLSLFFGLVLFNYLLGAAADSPQTTKDSLRIVTETSPDHQARSEAHIRLAAIFSKRYLSDSALWHLHAARSYFDKLSDTTRYQPILFYLDLSARAYSGDYKEALAVTNANIGYIEENFFGSDKSPFEEVHPLFIPPFVVYNQIGDLYRKIGDFEAAYDFFIRAMNNAESMNNPNGRADCYNNLGILYDLQDDYKKAIQYYNRARHLNLEIGASRRFMLASNYNNMGIVYKNLDQFDSAALVYEKALEIMLDMGASYGEAVIRDNMGLLYLKQGRYQDALREERQALAIQRERNAKDQEAMILLNIGDIYFQQRDFSNAINYGLEAYGIASKGEQHETIRMLADHLNQAYDSIGDIANAYKFLKIYKDKEELLSNEAKEETIANLKIKYETDQQKVENELLRQQQANNAQLISQQRNYLLASIIGILMIFVILLLIFRLYKSANRQKMVVGAQNEKIKELSDMKSRFFANISHDFRSPLTLIKGNLDVISREENFLTQETEASMTRIDKNVNHLIQLTDEIRDLILLDERKFQLHFSKVDVGEFFRINVNLFHSAAQVKDISLQLTRQFSAGLYIHADVKNLEKILYNLISNAIKFTGSGGHIEVRVKEENSGIKLYVTDDGMGILPEDQDRIFDRFHQNLSNDYHVHEGMGVGLSLVKELVLLHHGEIEVSSQPGDGATFSVFLPFNYQEDVDKAPFEFSYTKDRLSARPKSSTDATHRVGFHPADFNLEGKTLLVVDDHEEVREYICAAINDGYKLLEASNGREALQLMSKYEVDLVVTDLMMPWMDGFDLIDQIKELPGGDELPILVVSARTTREDRLRVLDLGVNDFLNKPFDRRELNRRIQNLLQRRKTENVWDQVAGDQNLKSELEKDLLNKINQLIVARVSDPTLSLADLADEMAASERSLNRMVKNLTGLSPKQYVQKVRMEYAKDLLVKRRVKSVAEAGRAIGNANGTHFSRSFKKFIGRTPSEILEK